MARSGRTRNNHQLREFGFKTIGLDRPHTFGSTKSWPSSNEKWKDVADLAGPKPGATMGLDEFLDNVWRSKLTGFEGDVS